MNIDKAKLIEAIENSCYGQNYVQYDDILKIINSIPTTEPKLPTVEEIRSKADELYPITPESNQIHCENMKIDRQIFLDGAMYALTLLKSKQLK